MVVKNKTMIMIGVIGVLVFLVGKKKKWFQMTENSISIMQDGGSAPADIQIAFNKSINYSL